MSPKATYDSFRWQFNQIVDRWVACILRCDIFQRRIPPIYVDGREVDTPNHDILSIGGHSLRYIDIKALNLFHKRCLVDCVLYPRYKVRIVGLIAVLGQGTCACSGYGILIRGILVRKYRESVWIVI